MFDIISKATIGAVAGLAIVAVNSGAAHAQDACAVSLMVLGVAQDGGIPQINTADDPAWEDPRLTRLVSSIAVIDSRGATPRRYLFDATPDLREQYRALDRAFPGGDPGRLLDGVFLTHAHMGHYTGLMFFGFESANTRGTPVYAMPRMAEYLRRDGPWSQLVDYGNIELREMAEATPVQLAEGLRVTPLRVPHREEYSEAVGFRIEGPEQSALFIPDIDSWDDWAARGVRLEDEFRAVDYAYLDATFFADGEIPGRDMSGIPHPRVVDTMARLAHLADAERARLRFIHINHTNPLRDPASPESAQLRAAGYRIAEEGEIVCLAERP